MTTNYNYEENDLVWAKMKGFPPWPARVSKPIKQLIKKPKKNCISIFFFGTNDYAWVEPKCLKPFFQFKDTLTNCCKTEIFKQSMKEIEQHIEENGLKQVINNELFKAESKVKNLDQNETSAFQRKKSKTIPIRHRNDKNMAAKKYDLETLITLVQQRPPIYCYKVRQHGIRDVQNKLWAEISTILDAPVSDCKAKWAILRNSFCRALREEKKIPSGSLASNKSKWYLYDNMSFLTDRILPCKTLDNNVIEDDLNSEESEMPNTEEEHHVSSELTPNSPMCEETIQSSSTLPVFKKQKKIEKVLTNEMVAEPMVNYLNAKTIQRVEDSSEFLFLKSIVPDFQKLNDKNQRKFKSSVLSSIDELLSEQEALSVSTIYSKNLMPLYSHQVPIQQHTPNQSQPSLNNETTTDRYTTHFNYSESPGFSSSRSSTSYQ